MDHTCSCACEADLHRPCDYFHLPPGPQILGSGYSRPLPQCTVFVRGEHGFRRGSRLGNSLPTDAHSGEIADVQSSKGTSYQCFCNRILVRTANSFSLFSRGFEVADTFTEIALSLRLLDSLLKPSKLERMASSIILFVSHLLAPQKLSQGRKFE